MLPNWNKTEINVIFISDSEKSALALKLFYLIQKPKADYGVSSLFI